MEQTYFISSDFSAPKHNGSYQEKVKGLESMKKSYRTFKNIPVRIWG